MAKTSVSTSDALRVAVWEETLYRDVREAPYMARFTGKGSKVMIQDKVQLEKQKGDKITFGIRYRLTGSGVKSGQTLEGREEKLSTSDFAVELERYRHAVRDNGDLSRRRPVYSMRTESRDALSDWGSEKIDRLLFGAALTNPTKVVFPLSRTAITNIVAGDKLTMEMISRLKTGAKTGWARKQVPFRPLKVDGKSYYVLIVSDDVAYDLKRDSEWTTAQREAQNRGKDNPIFTGALGVWDGVIIHSHDLMQELADVTNFGVGADVPGSTCLFMGAQALVMAWGERLNVVDRDFDYGEEMGYAIRMTCKAAKPKFTKAGESAADYAVAVLKVARTQISDA